MSVVPPTPRYGLVVPVIAVNWLLKLARPAQLAFGGLFVWSLIGLEWLLALISLMLAAAVTLLRRRLFQLSWRLHDRVIVEASQQLGKALRKRDSDTFCHPKS